MNTVKMTDCELLVMKCVWVSDHEMALPEIVDMVNTKFSKEWKSQTVSTFLARLVKKEFLTLYRSGRQFYYVPLIQEKDYKENVIEECVEFWCDNDASNLLVALGNKRKLTKAEIAGIKELLTTYEK
jgi:predicted transcriptional regulator